LHEEKVLAKGGQKVKARNPKRKKKKRGKRLFTPRKHGCTKKRTRKTEKKVERESGWPEKRRVSET